MYVRTLSTRLGLGKGLDGRLVLQDVPLRRGQDVQDLVLDLLQGALVLSARQNELVLLLLKVRSLVLDHDAEQLQRFNRETTGRNDDPENAIILACNFRECIYHPAPLLPMRLIGGSLRVYLSGFRSPRREVVERLLLLRTCSICMQQ